MSLTALNAILTADTSGFTGAMTRARGSMTNLSAVSQRIFNETRTPLEQYQAQLTILNGLLARGQLDTETYGRAVSQIKSAYAAASPAAQQLAQHLAQLDASAKRVFQGTRTPAEQYKATIDELDTLLRSGRINQETYGRAVAQSEQTFQAASPAAQRFAQHLRELDAAAKRVFQGTRTPAENYKASIRELNSLLASGRINQETYGRAVSKAKQDLDAASPAAQKLAQQTRELDAAAKRVFQGTRSPMENYRSGMNELNTLFRTGRVNQQTYARQAALLGQQFRTSSIQASGLGQALGGMGINLAAFANPVTAAVAVVATATAALAALSNAAINAGIHGIKLAADYEHTQGAFTTMLGSAQQAESVLNDLSQFAAETPFEFDELSGAAKKLLAFGTSADQITPTLRALGDVSSGIGQPLGEIAEIYGKIRTQGRLYGDDLKQLGGRGIPIVAELAKQFGVAESKIPKLVEQGKVGFPEVQRVIKQLTEDGGRFEGMTARASQELLGLSSTLSDNVNLALRDFGTAISQDLDFAGALKQLIELTGVLQSDIAPSLAHATAIVADLGVALVQLDPTIGALAATFGLFTDATDTQASVLETFHAGLIAIRATIAHWKGDQKGVARLMQEQAALAGRIANREKQKAKPAEFKVDQRGPDTTAQEKAASDFKTFAEQLDHELQAIGKSSQQAKLDEFFKLAQKGEIKLDTDDLDQARQKLAALERGQTQQKLAELNAELQKQIATFGMTANQVKLYELAQKGANQADADAIRVLDAKHEALKRQKEVADFTKELQKRIALVGQGGGDADKFYDLQAKGATTAELADARRLSVFHKQKEALQQVADEMRKVADSSKLFTTEMAQPFQALYEKLQELGKQLEQGKITQQQFDRAKERGMHLAKSAVGVFDETRKPLEKFQADMNELRVLFANGFIDEDTFDRASKKKIGELDKEGKKNPAALEKGSAEAYSALLRARQAESGDTVAARQYAEAVKANAILERINQRLGQKGPQVQIRDMR